MSLQTTLSTQQRLILAPHITIALEILQLPVLALEAFLEAQAEENPLLEFQTSETSLTHSSSPISDPSPETDSTHNDTQKGVAESWAENPWDADGEKTNGDPYEGEVSHALERILPNPESLQMSLLKQLRCQALDPEDYRIAELIIHEINDSGYLDVSLEELAQAHQVDRNCLKTILHVVQQLEPAGVGARDLRECLMLQMEHRGAQESLAYRILRNHFPLFVQQRSLALAKALGVSGEDIAHACSHIRQLHPKPGSAFSNEPTSSTMIPDLIVVQGEHYCDVELNDEAMPRVRLNRVYRRMLTNPNTASETREFITQKLRQAQWIIRAIEERNTTLLAIGRCLISLQREFFEQGIQALKPLTQAQVAQIIGRHPSTVSRAIAEKTIACSLGIFRLERFFPSRVPQLKNTLNISDAMIKQEIQRLISEEDRRSPLSDEALVKLLAERNLSVARRTVAKYRTSLKILPVYLRKRRALDDRKKNGVLSNGAPRPSSGCALNGRPKLEERPEAVVRAEGSNCQLVDSSKTIRNGSVLKQRQQVRETAVTDLHVGG